MDVGPLHAGAAAVNEPDFAEAAGPRFGQIFEGHAADFVRPERVQIERIFDRNLDRLVVVHRRDSMRYFRLPMVLFNHATREMTAKIVYYGPGLCGKTTNLMVVFDQLEPDKKGKMLSLATKTDRTLFFDLLPVDIGKVGTFNLKIQLYTVPGQVFYNETRKLVLKGADAVVFVVDSQPSMLESNRDSFANLLENLEENQIDPNDTPIIVQFNKRDIPGVLPVEEIQESLHLEGYPYTEAAAVKGEGVMETFRLISKITAKHLLARLKGRQETPLPKKAAVAEAPAPAAAPPPPPAPNPFADSVPFPETAADGYESAEEVSLDELLEGRERPTFTGAVPVPPAIDDEEIEELGADELIAAPPVAVMEEPEPEPEPEPLPEPEPEPLPVAMSGDGRVAELEAELLHVREQLERERTQHRAALQDVLQHLSDLTERIRQLT